MAFDDEEEPIAAAAVAVAKSGRDGKAESDQKKKRKDKKRKKKEEKRSKKKYKKEKERKDADEVAEEEKKQQQQSDDDDDGDSSSSSSTTKEGREGGPKKKGEKKRQRNDQDSSSRAVEAVASPLGAKKTRKKKPREEAVEEDADGGDGDIAGAGGRPFVESSALEFSHLPDKKRPSDHNTSLLLFYQYLEPVWTSDVYRQALAEVERIGIRAQVTGRMRVAREGLNCTLTGTRAGIYEYCQGLRQWKPEAFSQTEFKLTHDLPDQQRFPALKVIPVTELVHYGLDKEKAPPIHQYQGVHLEPREYHQKLAEADAVVIDVRNHYEATIGRFDPPRAAPGGQEKWIDPKMRKSTEFPVWLDDPATKEQLKGKQVLMYCTGGIRCERASALLKYRMETDPTVASLGIQGVYQLQGGIDKYFEEFPDGGYWRGKNYVFDKRFAHPPPAVQQAVQQQQEAGDGDGPVSSDELPAKPMGKCEACSEPWDRYRGKRRCPTCGVPSLICRACWQAHEDGTRKIDRSVRCDLCVEQNIRSKRDLRDKEQRELQEYETKLAAKGLLQAAVAPNPQKVTRLYLKNMCRNNMTDEILMGHLAGITHIVWRTDRKSGKFFGQGWIEMESPNAAALAVARSGERVLGRPLYVEYQPPDGKDAWPLPSSAVRRQY